jgi:hypothetical protein
MHMHPGLDDLVQLSDVTHTATQNGNWSAASTWGGSLPGNNAKVHIPAGIVVTVDQEISQRLFSLRVNGDLKFARNANTELKVETLVVYPEGYLEIGTTSNPIQTNKTAKILILDNGNINLNYDGELLSRGLIAMGEVRMHGAVKDAFVRAAQWIPSGSSTINLAQAPVGWAVGDQIVLSGLFHGEYEEFTIAAISGSQITLNQPTANNRTIGDSYSGFNGLYPYVANYSRNIAIESENKQDIHRRGHLMFMHTNDVDVRYVRLDELGRTNKAIEFTKTASSSTSNMVGRYGMHFHRGGDQDPNGIYAKVKGCALWGSPGWGYVNHEASVWFEDNASYNVFGSHYTDENGTERGGFLRNIAIRSTGSSPTAGEFTEKTRTPGDHGHSGVGFWATTGASVRWEDNVATDQNMSGFAIITRRQPEDAHDYDWAIHDNPAMGGGRKTSETNSTQVGINFFRNNISYGAYHGLVCVDLELNGKYNSVNLFEDFTSVNNRKREAVAITYSRNIYFKNAKLLRDITVLQERSTGIKMHSTYDHFFQIETKAYTWIENVKIHGYDHAFELIRKDETLDYEDDNKVYIIGNNNDFDVSGTLLPPDDVALLGGGLYNDYVVNVSQASDIPDRPSFSIPGGTYGSAFGFTINVASGTTVYYQAKEIKFWNERNDLFRQLRLVNAQKYTGQTIQVTDRTAIVAVAVDNATGLQSRAMASWYYIDAGAPSPGNVAVTGVDLTTSGPLSLAVDDDQLLDYSILPGNATNQNVSWSSSNSNVANVSSQGVVAGNATGTATITVTTDDGSFTDQITVNVSASPPTTYTLTVNASNGSVSKSPNQSSYASGTSVSLTASPDSSYQFDNWSGAASGSNSTVTVTMNSNKTVTANFSATTPGGTTSDLAEWDFAGTSGSSSVAVSATASGITASSAALGSGFIPTSYNGGNGLTGRDQTAATLSAAISDDDYLSFTLTPSGSMSVTAIKFRPVAQNDARTFALLSSKDGFNTSSVIGSFSAQSNGGSALQTINVSGHNSLSAAVEFRVYIYGQTSQYGSVGMGLETGLDLIVEGSTGSGGPSTYTLTVNSGSGDGSYTSGTSVSISANGAPSGQQFDQWTGNVSGIANVNASNTTLTMPASNTTITATYEAIPTSSDLAEWDFAGTAGSSSVAVSSTASGITASSAALGSGFIATSYNGGNGLTGRNQTQTTLSGAISDDDYLSFTLTPSSSMSVTAVKFRPVAQNDARTFALLSSKDGFNTSSVIGSFSAQSNGGAALQTITVSGHNSLSAAVEFRVYIYGQTSQWGSVGMGLETGLDLIVEGSTGSNRLAAPESDLKTLYPNPTTGRLLIEVNTAEQIDARLYGLTGQEVMRQQAAGKTLKFDLSSLPAGMYILSVNGERTRVVKQ